MEEWVKSDSLECLKTSSCDVSMTIVDAAAIVHIWPEPFTNFQQYVERHLSRAWYRSRHQPDLTWSGRPILIKVWKA